MNKLEARLEAMRRLLQDTLFMSVQDLSDRLNVSPMTVRRDLKRLSDDGLVQRIHGGGMWCAEDMSVGQRAALHTPAKWAIAEAAVAVVQAGGTIALDSGTTTAQVAKALLHGSARPLTVVTYALNVAEMLMEDPTIQVHVSGGDVRPGTASLVGPRSRAFFESIHVDRAFVTAVGVLRDEGWMNSNFAEAEIKTALCHCARHVYALVDTSKVDRRGLVRFAQLDEVDTIISNGPWPDPWGAALKAQDITLSVALEESALPEPGTRTPGGLSFYKTSDEPR